MLARGRSERPRKDHALSSSGLCGATSSGPVRLRAGAPYRSFGRLATAMCIVVLLASCNSTPPPSAPASSSAVPSPSPTPAAADVTPLDACDPAGYVPCDQQAAVLSIPIVDTNLALTYSSQWAAGRQDRPNWNANGLGLGGWSINVLERYDATDRRPPRRRRVLALRDGRDASRQVARQCPSFDGSVAYVFDAAGHHVRTVDGHLGTTLLTPGLRQRRTPELGGRVGRRAGRAPDRPAQRPGGADRPRRDRRRRNDAGPGQHAGSSTACAVRAAPPPTSPGPPMGS